MTAAALALGSLALLPGTASAASGDLTYSCTYGALVSGAQPTTVTIDTDAPATSPVGEPLQVLTTTSLKVPDSVHSALSALGATSVQLLAVDPDGVPVNYDFGDTSTPVRTHPAFHFDQQSWSFTGTSGGAYSINPGPKTPGTYLVHAGAIDLDLTVATSSGTTTYPVSCTVPTGKLVDQILVTDTTSTALSLSSSSATYGATPAPVATATVTRGGTPASGWPALGGTIQFKDGSTVLGTVTPNSSGTATYSLAGLKSGQHSITAAYVPATSDPYLASTSSASPLKVSSPTTTTVADIDPVDVGGDASATATVTATDGTMPTGSVSFSVDGGTATSVPLSGDTATFKLPTGTPGTHTVTASYGGATYLTGSDSAAKEYGVGAPTETTVALTASRWAHNDESPRATATVTAPGADATWPTISGTVQFKSDGTDIGEPVEVTADGTATLTQLGDLSLGDHAITAEYSPAPGSAYALSTSAQQSLHVDSHTVTSLTIPSVVGIDAEGVTVIAKVKPDYGDDVPTGTVTFTVDGVEQPSVQLGADGKATSAELPTGTAGQHTIKATYSGDDTNVTSTSPTGSYTVGAAPTTTTFTMAGSAKYGMRNVVRATVRSPKGVPNGKVTFRILGGASSRSVVAVVKKGVATATLPTLAPGAYQVDAAFAPANTGKYHTSGAAAKWLRVSRDSTRTTGWVRGVKLHQRPTAHIAVHGVHSKAAGKIVVQLRRNGKVVRVRTATLHNGKAVVTFGKIGRAGTWAVVATYTGSADHTGSAVKKTVVVKAAKHAKSHKKAHKKH